MANDTPGWDQYSRLILQQLESLSTGIEALRQELQEVKRELTEIKAKEDRVQEMKIWKDKIDEIASPRQLKVALDDLDELKVFKTKAVTIFAVVQFFMATALALSSYF
jgi:polyribonucleotide nucleotidyltransferase|tara:strand:+ start:73 stop:396 length:324 start_codon:yes stop_codon:yes gene_type:complete